MDNHASADGGGMYNDGPGQGFAVSVTGSTLIASHAGGRGGGIYTREDTTIDSSSITGNQAGTTGGGIYDDDDQSDGVSTGVVSVTSTTTVARNHPDNCAPPGSVTGC